MGDEDTINEAKLRFFSDFYLVITYLHFMLTTTKYKFNCVCVLSSVSCIVAVLFGFGLTKKTTLDGH